MYDLLQLCCIRGVPHHQRRDQACIRTHFNLVQRSEWFLGGGLGEILANGGNPDLSIIWSPNVLGPLLGLAALSALPIILNTGNSDEV